jgi:hypothetical protein
MAAWVASSTSDARGSMRSLGERDARELLRCLEGCWTDGDAGAWPHIHHVEECAPLQEGVGRRGGACVVGVHYFGSSSSVEARAGRLTKLWLQRSRDGDGAFWIFGGSDPFVPTHRLRDLPTFRVQLLKQGVCRLVPARVQWQPVGIGGEGGRQVEERVWRRLDS